MYIYLILLFTVLPATELLVIIKVGNALGAMNTLALLILTGVVGATLARLQGFLVISKVQENINRGILPSEELIDGFLILIGGILLLTPGFITDTVGILLLLPPARFLVKSLLKRKMSQMIQEGQVVTFTHSQQTKSDGFDDIDITP